MPAPATVDEFLELSRKSGLLDKSAVDSYCLHLREADTLPDSPRPLAEQMIQDGLLTNFQAEYLLAGRWRGFIIAGKYRLLRRVGAGGMGSVFLCEHILMKRRVALKVLPASQAEDPTAVARFHREARAVAALDHPNIVRAHDIDCDNKLHFLVMEYVDGSSFQEIVKRTGPMDVTRAAHYIAQAAVGLDHAAKGGVVHRDIKPGNILVDRGGAVKILDMGLARFFHDDHDELTREHESTSVLGTADYLAPEQALNSHDVDIRADIYSLGATFYFLLTGKSPFQDGNVAQKLIWHQVRQPKPISTLRADVPNDLAAVVGKMLAKDPDERYQTPLEVVEALTPWTQTPIGPPPEEEMPQFGKAALGELGARSAASSHRVASQVLVPSSSQSGNSGSGSRVSLRTGSTIRERGLRANADTPRSIPSNTRPRKENAKKRRGKSADNSSGSTVYRKLLALQPNTRLWLIVAALCSVTLLGYGSLIFWIVSRQ